MDDLPGSSESGARSAPSCLLPDKSHPEARWRGPGGEVFDRAWWSKSACPTPKIGLALAYPSGRMAPLPCGRVRCPHCAAYHALTALEMVRDTSDRMGNPTVAITLTTADPDRPLGKAWSKDVEQVTRALRRRHQDAEYLGFMEWTTGRAKTAGGRRRPHQHFLARGIPRSAAEATEQVVREVWEARTGASRVEVAPLRSNERGIAYLALHHGKESQAPPDSFTGRRLRASKGWWGRPAAEVRSEAKERLRTAHTRKQLMAQLSEEFEAQGVPPDVLDDPDVAAELVAPRMERSLADRPTVVILNRVAGGRAAAGLAGHA